MKLFSFILTSLLLVNTLLTAEAPTSWVFGTEYENGTIVTYGKNTYKALKDVPESVGGYPNTLIDYWININKLMPGLDHNTSLAYPKGVKVASGNVYYSSIADYIPVGISITNTNYWEQTNFNFDKDEANTLNIPNASEIIDNNYTPPEDSSTVNSRFLGISTRGPLSNSYKMYGGLTVLGTESKRVAFMAKGVSMSAQGITDYVSDPKLEIFRKEWDEEAQRKKWKLIRTVDDWGDVNSTESITNAEGATGVILPIGEKEAGIVLDLIPANYTFNVSTTDESTSQAIVEAYEID